jgi:hypothetical protein
VRACIGQSQGATLGHKEKLLVSRFGRPLTGATVKWEARWWDAGLVVQLLKRSTSGGELDSSAGYRTQNCVRTATAKDASDAVRTVHRAVCGERTRCRGEMTWPKQQVASV